MSRPGLFSASIFRKKSAVFLGLGLMLASVSCETTQQQRPEITPAVLAAGAKHGAGERELANGREIFATRCTQCHRMQPVGEFSTATWAEIIARMSPRSKLSDAERADLLAYVTAARETMP